MTRVKDNKINFIIEEATNLFQERSIISVTISDIAKKVEIGEATLYRYFQKKQNIVMQASVKLSEKVADEYFTIKPQTTGYEELCFFFNAYLTIFTKHPQYFKFINELDAYIITEEVAEKSEYENTFNLYKEIFNRSYQKGLADGSVKEMEDVENFYYASTHSLLNLCKFLSSKGILSHDEVLDKNKEIKIIIDIVLAALKK